MGRHPQDVTDAELAVLKVLWAEGSLTIRQITEKLYPHQSESDYATVKKLLSRLEKKQCVRRDREQIAHEFQASIDLDELLGRRLQGVADHLCDGSRIPLLMHLLKSDGITAAQQRELKQLVQDLAATPRKSAKHRKTK